MCQYRRANYCFNVNAKIDSIVCNMGSEAGNISAREEHQYGQQDEETELTTSESEAPRPMHSSWLLLECSKY